MEFKLGARIYVPDHSIDHGRFTNDQGQAVTYRRHKVQVWGPDGSIEANAPLQEDDPPYAEGWYEIASIGLEPGERGRLLMRRLVLAPATKGDKACEFYEGLRQSQLKAQADAAKLLFG